MSQKSMLFTRFVWGNFVVCAVMFVFLGAHLKESQSTSISLRDYAIGALAVWSAIGPYFARRKLLDRSRANSAAKDVGSSFGSERTLQAAHIVGFASAESIVLWGFVAKIGDSPQWFCNVLYTAGILLLLSYWPTSHASQASPQ